MAQVQKSTNPYVGLSMETLLTLQGNYVQAITELVEVGVEYTIVGSRTWRSADLPQLEQTLLSINAAIASANGTGNPRQANPLFHRNCNSD